MNSVHAGNHLRLLAESESVLAKSCASVALRHEDQPDVPVLLREFARWSIEHVEKLQPILERYAGAPTSSAHVLSAVLFKGQRKRGIGLLRDLQDLHLLAGDVHGGWSIAGQLAVCFA